MCLYTHGLNIHQHVGITCSVPNFPSNSPPQACNSDLFSGDIFPHLLNLVVNHIDNIKVKAHDSEFLTRFSYDHMSTRDFRLCVIDS